MEKVKIDKINEYIETIRYIMRESGIDPREGLPEELFLFASSLVPLVNVDLLIEDCCKGILFVWRDDMYHGKGWHIPGGCIRVKETVEKRIQLTALNEIGSEVHFNSDPILIQEEIIKKERPWLKDELVRSHNISMLFKCKLPDGFNITNDGTEIVAGYKRWFDHFPENLLECHKELYGDLLLQIFKEGNYGTKV